MRSRHLVGMVIASPEVRADLEVSRKPNQDTEQGLSPIVTQEVDREVPRHPIGEQCSPLPPKSLLLFNLEERQN